MRSVVFCAIASSVTAGPVLLPPALGRLPLGSSKPQGWLKQELVLQAEGLSGQLPDFWHYINESFWLGDKGSQPEQFVPYYLDGLVPLSHLVENAKVREVRDRYLGHILRQQAANLTGGWLGPELSKKTETEARNYWGKYPFVKALEQQAEADSAARPELIGALVQHHRAFYDSVLAASPDFRDSKWGYARHSEALVGLQWLLDHGRSDPFLWDLMHMIRNMSDSIMRSEGGYSWQDWYESGDPFSPHDDSVSTQHLLRHGVDIGEGMKTGALWWRASGAADDLQNPEIALQWAEKYLHMSDGMFFADEMVSGQHTPQRGTETCSVVETMYSMRVAYEITGNVLFMDRLERLAFNSLPAALWPDVTANVYHHCSNQLNAGGHPYGYDLYFCCTANMHQGWPKFAAGPVHSNGSAIVVSSYAPSLTQLPEGGSIEVAGVYPFADNVTLLLELPRARELQLRIPCWTEGARVVGPGAPMRTAPCSFFSVQLPVGRSSVLLDFEQQIRLYTWPDLGAVEVHRGPLVYALRPKTEVEETPIFGSIANRSVRTTGAWNYGLDLSQAMRFEPAAAPVPADEPFSASAPAPVRILAKGRRVPQWGAGSGHGPDTPPVSPVASAEPLEELELVPFGATNVRISVFPTLTQSDPEVEWLVL